MYLIEADRQPNAYDNFSTNKENRINQFVGNSSGYVSPSLVKKERNTRLWIILHFKKDPWLPGNFLEQKLIRELVVQDKPCQSETHWLSKLCHYWLDKLAFYNSNQSEMMLQVGSVLHVKSSGRKT